MKLLSQKKKSGYIALMSVIIICMILLALVSVLTMSNYFSRSNVSNREYKMVSMGLAESCANVALLRLASDFYYNPSNEVIPVGENECIIKGITGATSSKMVETSGEFVNAFSNMEVEVEVKDPIVSPVTRATLTVVTHVINDEGGSRTASDFTIMVTANDPFPNNFPGSESGQLVLVNAGSYDIASINPGGYTRDYSSDCSGSVAVGRHKTCVITYNDLPTAATLTLIANVKNDDGGTKTPSDFSISLGGTARVSGQPFSLAPGNYTASSTDLSGYTASFWGYHCAGNGDVYLAAGDKKTCIIAYDDNPPPTPTCADTVMVLDRSYSMFGYPDYPSGCDQWIPDEKTAAKSLVDLYSTVTPSPKIGVGRFGDVSTGRSAEIITQLTTNYSGVKTSIDNGLPENPISYTNLSAAITAGNNELNSSRHDPTKQKVLILVSDGEPNEPSGSVSLDTGFKSPSANVQNGSNDFWNSPANAYANSGGEASSTASLGDRHRLYNFDFSIPSNATIKGIQAQTDAWVTLGSVSADTPSLAPSASGNYTEWTPNTGTDVNAVSSNNGETSYIDISSMVHTFAFSNSAVPTGATINSVTINAIAKGTASGATMQLVAENGGTPNAVSTINLTTDYQTYARTMTTNPLTGSAWTLSEVNNWTIKFGARAANGSTVRITYMYLVVTYTTTSANNVQEAPGAIHAPSQWSNAGNAFASDNVYATNNTNNQQQGYSNFGFSIPSNATIQGIVVTTEAKVSGATPLTTATLYPNGQGDYTGWTGDESDIDENGSPSCSGYWGDGDENISESTTGERESVRINLSSVPDGSTITSVDVVVWYRDGNSSGADGTFQTFTRLNDNDLNSGTNLSGSNSSCISGTQTINVSDTFKDGATTLEVGVIKTANDTSEVWVGAIRAVITYIPPNLGSLGIVLSSNNGGSWTSSKSVSLTGTEAVSSPAGNSSSDTWGRSWAPADFNDGNFVLRVQNDSTNGYTVSLDQTQVTVYYTVTTQSSTGDLTPTATGNYEQWTPNTGTDVNAVSTSNSDTSYIDVSSMVHTFAFSNSAVPTGATINSVTLYAIARGTASGATMQFVAENGGTPNAGSSISLTTSYATYSRQMTTNPLTGSAWTLSEVNNWTTKFGVYAINGSTVRVTQLYVVVNYSIVGNVACQLGVDFSWNGGTNWTSEKMQTLTGAETSYTLGSATDDWTTHSWQPSEFSNSNFRARVRAIDPGSACDNSAIDHLDWFQTKVYYTQPTDPTDAAYIAADAAKLSGTDIFTIHFGDSAGRDLLAKLASGNTVNSPHQNGSYFETSGIVNSDTGYISPTVQLFDSGGDGNGFESNPNSAFVDGSGDASNMNGSGDRHRFYGYNISLPPGAVVNGIVVRPDWWTESNDRNNSVSVELSWNGGASWTSAKTEDDESTNDQNNKTVGGSTDNWGRAWSSADFTSSNFRVRITSNCSGGWWGSSCSNRDFYLDWIPVRVYYTVIAENGDDDNFFVSPTSADMQNIFETIGEKVCTALSNPTPPSPPTTANLIVINYVINDNSGTSSASEFTMNVTGVNPSTTTFSGVGVPGATVVLGPGSYNVYEDALAGYVMTVGVGCSSIVLGDINAGETRTCTIINDDIPPTPVLPAPPEPEPNIIIDSWVESP